MCGITGIIHLDKTPVLAGDMDRFTDSLVHRGPDGRGVWFSPGRNIAFGHRRLSILDLSDAASQPMTREDLGLTLVYNGEVYNFIELRTELIQAGYSFLTQSDTEVILCSWHKWGVSAFNKFNGMWAMAIYDHKSQQITLCRDRFGIKPLFYTHSQGKFAFASETRSFRTLPWNCHTVDETMLDASMADPFAPAALGKTLYSEIQTLPGGHYITIHADGFSNPVQWFHLSAHIQPFHGTYNEAVEMFRDLFLDAVAIRLRSDVGLATALSGGLDSSSVYSALYHLGKSGRIEGRVPDAWQQAFIMSFPGHENDEAAFAMDVVNHVHGKATVLSAADCISPENITASARQLDQLNGTPLVITDAVYQAVNKGGYKISMDGHGADEYLYGYRDMVYDLFMNDLWHGSTSMASEWMDVLVPMYIPSHQHSTKQRLQQDLEQAIRTRKRLRHRIGSWIKKTGKPHQNLPAAYQQWLSGIHPDRTGFGEQLSYSAMFRNPLPSILRNFDVSSMRHGVESRMPFLDYRLVAFTMSLPLEFRVGAGFTKRILRDALRDIMPETISNRTYKVGFTTEMNSWLNGTLNSWALDLVHSGDFISNPYIKKYHVSGDTRQSLLNKTLSVEQARKLWLKLNLYLITSH
ncbi:MAG: asparagine synthase (glutamine-hydrolyzing) [Bacteroidetes bacterium]|nr:asparagine synthase (glutamine-hydrolyzing) [Bacteroidota bacterium]